MSNPAPILAAVDFSPQARHAAQRAARVARHRACPLALLHVVPEAPLAQLHQLMGGNAAPGQWLLDDARRQLSELAGSLALAGAAPDCRALVGPPVDEILRQAEATGAQLLVLGARGTSYLRRLVLGSTAERLLRRSPRPLLVVRQTPHEPYRRALVAVDFSPWSTRCLELAREVAPDAELLLATVVQLPFEDKLRFAGIDDASIQRYRQRARHEALHRLDALAQAAGLAPSRWRPCVLEGDPSLRIVETEQEHDCDLVVLGKHGVSAAVDLLLGSTTRHVLAEGTVDVLIATAAAQAG